MDLADPNFEHTPYDPWVAYGRAKTANVLFAVEFDRRHRGRGVRATAVHPGGIRTDLGRHVDESTVERIVADTNAELAAKGLPPYRFKTIAEGPPPPCGRAWWHRRTRSAGAIARIAT